MNDYFVTIEETHTRQQAEPWRPRSTAKEAPRGYQVIDGRGDCVHACMECYTRAIERVHTAHDRCSCCTEIVTGLRCDVCGRDA